VVASVLCAAVPLYGANAASQDVKDLPRTAAVPRPIAAVKKANATSCSPGVKSPGSLRTYTARRRSRARAPVAQAGALSSAPQMTIGLDTGTVGDIIASGIASWYGRAWRGRRTSSGVPYDETALTAAHPWLPIGTRVRVTVEDTNQSVIVIINDRQGSAKRVIDLSEAAARELGILGRGVARVTLTRA
jgi:rare lipoprotein A (peptidoglycan hydrolase)